LNNLSRFQKLWGTFSLPQYSHSFQFENHGQLHRWDNSLNFSPKNEAYSFRKSYLHKTKLLVNFILLIFLKCNRKRRLDNGRYLLLESLKVWSKRIFNFFVLLIRLDKEGTRCSLKTLLRRPSSNSNLLGSRGGRVNWTDRLKKLKTKKMNPELGNCCCYAGRL